MVDLPKGLSMSPARFAELSSDGRWQWARHLGLLNAELVGLMAGETDILLGTFPPRHGKTDFGTIAFGVYWLGLNPDHEVVVNCYNEEYAKEVGGLARDLMEKVGPEFFGLKVRKDTRSKTGWKIAKHRGGFRCVGRNGSLTGRGADLLIVDDPFRNWSEAISPAIRNAVWKQFTSTAFTRLAPGGKTLLLFTPWNPDDLGGRLLATMPGRVKVLRLPGLAEFPTPDETRADRVGYDALIGLPDPLGRAPDEPLWPERFGLDHFRRAEELDPETYEPLHMCRPRAQSGGLFRQEMFDGQVVDPWEVPAHVDARVRFWDRAATYEGGDFTVGCRIARAGNQFFVEDVVRERLDPTRRDALIARTCEADNEECPGIVTWTEQEPGSSGVDSALAFGRMLSPRRAEAERSTGPKDVRAGGLASACGRKDVFLVRGGWNRPFVLELCAFDPVAKSGRDDQVDAASGAFNKVMLKRAARAAAAATADDLRRLELLGAFR